MHISKRELELPETVLGELSNITAEKNKIINMGLGEPDFLTPKPILDYTKKIIKKSDGKD